MIIITNPHFSQNRVSRDSLPTQSSNYETECNLKTKSPKDFEAHLTLHNSSSTQEIPGRLKPSLPTH